MNWGTLLFWILALGGALIAVLQVAGGIRDLLTGLRLDLVNTNKARLDIEKNRLEIEKARLELEQKLPREIEKLSLEVANLRQEAFKVPPDETAHLQADFVRRIPQEASSWFGKEKPLL